MAFFLKKLVGEALMPVPVIMGLLVVGVLFHLRGGARWGRRLVGAGLVLFWAASCMPLARMAVTPLESAYPAFPGDSVAVVVVLGHGHTSAPGLPLSAVPEAQALYRLTEGVRIARDQPWATLVVSGYGGEDARSNAGVYQALAMELGMDPARIHAEPRPRDTGEESRLLAPFLAGRPFALVTSATHMPRAVALFRGQGLEPVPAPTGHLAKAPPSFDWRELFPSGAALTVTRQAWYEVLGRIWARIGG